GSDWRVRPDATRPTTVHDSYDDRCHCHTAESPTIARLKMSKCSRVIRVRLIDCPAESLRCPLHIPLLRVSHLLSTGGFASVGLVRHIHLGDPNEYLIASAKLRGIPCDVFPRGTIQASHIQSEFFADVRRGLPFRGTKV